MAAILRLTTLVVQLKLCIMTDGEHPNLELARRYIHAVEQRDAAAMAGFFDPQVVFEEMPSRLMPRGHRHDLASMRAAAERGKTAVRENRYEIIDAIAQGDRVAMRIRYRAVLARDFGPSLPAGSELRGSFAMFLRLRDGKIVEQQNYDCFEG
jgi:ketosteroid isomerase-like protein